MQNKARNEGPAESHHEEWQTRTQRTVLSLRYNHQHYSQLFEKVIRPLCRGRLIVPSADLSAPVAFTPSQPSTGAGVSALDGYPQPQRAD